MVDILCNYILLEYSPTVRSEAAIPCLVIAHFFTQQADLDGDHSLKVIAPEKWSEKYRASIANTWMHLLKTGKKRHILKSECFWSSYPIYQLGHCELSM